MNGNEIVEGIVWYYDKQGYSKLSQSGGLLFCVCGGIPKKEGREKMKRGKKREKEGKRGKKREKEGKRGEKRGKEGKEGKRGNKRK